MRFVKTRDRVQDLDADTITTLLYAQSSVLSTGNYFTNDICLLWQINSRFFPSSSAQYCSAQLTTIAIASSFVYFFMFLNPLSAKKEKTATPQCYSSSLRVTGFSVVRRRSVPSGRRPFYCINFGLFCCPPTLRPKVRHQFRILGASRTRRMTPPIHLCYMRSVQCGQLVICESFYRSIKVANFSFPYFSDAEMSICLIVI